MTLHLEVLRVDRKAKPAIDDSFAKTLGSFETVDQLRAALTKNMQAQAQRQAIDAHVENVIQMVVDQSDVAAPPPLIDEELNDMMRQLQDNVERERKISMDTYTRIIGKTVDELRTEARPSAERRVRSDLVLDAVAEAEGIEAPESEIEAQIRLVASQPTYSNKERRRLLSSDELRQRIARRLRKRHVVSRLLEITNPGGPVLDSGDTEHDQPAAVLTESQQEVVAAEPVSVAGAAGGAQDQQSEQES
jgi:trigger factor